MAIFRGHFFILYEQYRKSIEYVLQLTRATIKNFKSII